MTYLRVFTGHPAHVLRVQFHGVIAQLGLGGGFEVLAPDREVAVSFDPAGERGGGRRGGEMEGERERRREGEMEGEREGGKEGRGEGGREEGSKGRELRKSGLKGQANKCL